MATIEKDPVCGMDVDTTTSQLSTEYEGKTYWFCGKGCMLEFKDDPERFLDPERPVRDPRQYAFGFGRRYCSSLPGPIVPEVFEFHS